jgi:hypothetical protein
MPLPESVQGIIAARLDALPGEEKALLQDAAVIGKVFWLGALDATERQLHVLQQKEFVQRARRSSVEGETEFAFKHLLVRDVAYGQIPRAERADKHRRAAEWIESLGRPEDHAEMVAHHYANALELAHAAGQEVEEITTRARAALREAGDRAASLNALAQAERYYAEALALVPHEDPQRPKLLLRHARMRFLRDVTGADELAEARDALVAGGDREIAAEAALMLADLSWREGNRARMLEHLDEARSLVAEAPPSRIQVSVLSELARYDMLADRNDSAIEVGREALSMAEELGLDDLRAHALNNIGSARAIGGDPRGFLELEESVALASQVNSPNDLVRGHNNLAASHWAHAHLERARTGWEETLRLAEHFGHRALARFVEGGPAVVLSYAAGQWDEALQRAEAFLAEVESGSPHYQATASYGVRALIRLGRGDPVAAEADTGRAVELARQAKDPQRLHPSLSKAALVFISVGSERRAGETLDEALEDLAELRQLGLAGVDLHRYAWVGLMLERKADVLAVIDREPFQSPWIETARAVASSDFRGAADILAGIGGVSDEAFYRLCAADQLVREGRRAEADEQLQRALAFYRSVGATRYVREGEALLAASA